jgi:hypothetical protein
MDEVCGGERETEFAGSLPKGLKGSAEQLSERAASICYPEEQKR